MGLMSDEFNVRKILDKLGINRRLQNIEGKQIWTLKSVRSVNGVGPDDLGNVNVSGGGGSGNVTSVSVVNGNGFNGSVANPTTTPAITIQTTVTGLLKGNGTSVSAAVGDTDFQNPISLTTTGSSGPASFSGDVLNIPNYSAGSGGISRSIHSISTATNAGSSASTDYVYLVSGTTTLTLPTAAGNTNLYTVKNVGTGTVTIATTSAQIIDGSSSASLPVQYTSLDLISDGSNWNIV